MPVHKNLMKRGEKCIDFVEIIYFLKILLSIMYYIFIIYGCVCLGGLF